MSILLADPPLGEENCTALLLGGGLFSLLSVDRSASELFFFWLKTSFSGPPPPIGLVAAVDNPIPSVSSTQEASCVSFTAKPSANGSLTFVVCLAGKQAWLDFQARPTPPLRCWEVSGR